MIIKLRVAELFAGVGGFRLGLEGWGGKSATSFYTENLTSSFEVVWSNQWEPSTKIQHASNIYEERWGNKNHFNIDINLIESSTIPEHEVLVGGFPCQDYSVATTLKNSQGLLGKKGVLWWSIQRIISELSVKPKYLILENVDRILTSPANQIGRDFAIILKSLSDLGYIVEWKVINAADYGMPQRRKRTFIVCYHDSTAISNKIKLIGAKKWILEDGTLAKAFKNEGSGPSNDFDLEGDMVDITKKFNIDNQKKVFLNHGIMIDNKIKTMEIKPVYNGNFLTIKSILQHSSVPNEYRIDNNDLKKWMYLKGAKKESRKTSDGFEYNYSEGSMIFPDPIDKPSRTIITSEGGSAPSRFKHVIDDGNGFRRLTPIELERLNMFPDDFTKTEKISDSKRAFMMGNALVVGVVEKIGITLVENIKNS